MTNTVPVTRRRIIIISAVVVIAVVLFWFMMSGSEPDATNPASVSPAANTGVPVNVIQVTNQEIPTFIPITGRLQPENKIDIFSEVSGVLLGAEKPFKVGVRFNRGEILVKIDDSEARQNLISQKAAYVNTLARVVPDLKLDFPEDYESWRSYLLNIDLEQSLPPLPQASDDQLKLFLIGRNVYSQYYAIKQLETRLEKYRIRAPFDGTVTEALIYEGTLVRPAQRLGEFAQSGFYELEASVSAEDAAHISTGDKVTLMPTKSGKEYTGVVSRINAKVDQQTQTIRIFVRLGGKELRAGMYLEGRLRGRVFPSAVELPRDLLLENNKVFVVQEGTAQLQTLEILKFAEETVIAAGLEDDALVIDESKSPSFANTKVRAVKKR